MIRFLKSINQIICMPPFYTLAYIRTPIYINSAKVRYAKAMSDAANLHERYLKEIKDLQADTQT